ncbi:MAG: protoporphyrinogen oxidase, partial [Pirellulaceae bacterium]
SGSLIRAAMKQRKRSRAATKPSEAGSAARYASFVAPRGGMASMIERLAAKLPDENIRLNSPVEFVRPTEDGRWLVGGCQPGQTADTFDGVIIATPAHHAATILDEFDAKLSLELRQVEYASCAVVSLAYDRKQIEHSLDAFGFVVPLVEQRSILACNFSSVKYAGRAPDSTVLMRVFLGGDCQAGLLRLPHDDLITLAKLEVSDLLGIRGEPLLTQIKRHCRALPQYTIGHQDRVRRIEARLTPTIALAGSAYHGVGIPACVASGHAAADRLLQTPIKRNALQRRVPQPA